MKTNPSAPPPRPEPLEEWIRERAYYLWLDRGRPDGEDWQHWFEARAQLAGETAPPALATVYPPLHDEPPRPTPAPPALPATPRGSDPTHRFHEPAVARDARTAVASHEAPQRIRGRHFENAGRKRAPKGGSTG